MTDKKEEVQVTMWQHAIEKTIHFKIKNILLVLSSIIIFFSGFLIAQIANTKWVMRSYDTGFKTALDLNPAAGYSQIGQSFCYDSGNYYIGIKRKGNIFHIGKSNTRDTERVQVISKPVNTH